MLRALVVVMLAMSAVACWLRWRNALAGLPREATGDLPCIERLMGRRAGRRFTHVTLESAAVGSIRFVVSLPDPMPQERIPLLVVVAGQGTAAETLSVLGDLGPNAIIWFEWPFPPRLRMDRELARRLPALYRAALSVPGQLDAVLRWASRQRWAQRDRVSLVGYSLGALVVPAAQRLAQQRGASVGWTILAYGGAPIGAVLEANRGIGPSWIRPAIGATVDLLLRPVEPSVHLPKIRGRFLLLGGRADPVIPFEAAERMRRLTPDPHTVILFEGEHVSVAPKNRELLDTVVTASQSWLVEQGAIDPPRPAQDGSRPYGSPRPPARPRVGWQSCSSPKATCGCLVVQRRRTPWHSIHFASPMPIRHVTTHSCDTFRASFRG